MMFEPKNIIQIADQITSNKIGIFPFDTLLGLTGLPTQETITKLEKIKQRNSMPFILIIPNLSFLDSLVEPLNTYQTQLINTYWPGPFTFIFKKHTSVPDYITSNRPTIAIRLANFLPLDFLLSKLNSPILSTSANIHTQPVPVSVNDVDSSLLDQCDFCYEQLPPKFNQCSTIIDISNKKPIILRHGVGQFND